MGPDTVLSLRSLRDLSREFRDVRTLAGADDGQAVAVLREFLIAILLEGAGFAAPRSNFRASNW